MKLQPHYSQIQAWPGAVVPVWVQSIGQTELFKLILGINFFIIWNHTDVFKLFILGLVYLFIFVNDISTFVDYLLPKLSLWKNRSDTI